MRLDEINAVLSRSHSEGHSGGSKMVPSNLRSWARAVLLSIGPMVSSAYAEFAPDAEAVRPLRVGEHAPDFTADRADGTPYVFSSEHLQRPRILIFYRGGWCPFCNAQLADLRLVEPKLPASGFEVLFITTDRPESLYTTPNPQHIPHPPSPPPR